MPLGRSECHQSALAVTEDPYALNVRFLPRDVYPGADVIDVIADTNSIGIFHSACTTKHPSLVDPDRRHALRSEFLCKILECRRFYTERVAAIPIGRPDPGIIRTTGAELSAVRVMVPCRALFVPGAEILVPVIDATAAEISEVDTIIGDRSKANKRLHSGSNVSRLPPAAFNRAR